MFYSKYHFLADVEQLIVSESMNIELFVINRINADLCNIKIWQVRIILRKITSNYPYKTQLILIYYKITYAYIFRPQIFTYITYMQKVYTSKSKLYKLAIIKYIIIYLFSIK